MAEHTVVDWYMFCREVCMLMMLNESVPLGGKGVIVETDKSKFGKMKYGRGRPVDGQWVFGGIERGMDRCFFRVVEQRNKDTLLPIIRDWVLPGSVVMLDCWKACDCLKDHNYELLRVNHSLHFKDPDTGAHTNSIEET